MASYMPWILLVLCQVVSGNEKFRNEGFIDRLNNGMKIAKDFLGSESVALKVAEFVVRAFQTANKPQSINNKRRPPSFNHAYFDENSQSEKSIAEEKKPNFNANEALNMTPLRNLVRLFGLQPNQISAVAVNALVFVAQMISTFLAGPKRPDRTYREDNPTTWILNKNSRKLQDIIATAKNESLADMIEELIKEQGTEEETSCIRLLVCKITPFVFKMQQTVFGNIDQEKNTNDLKNFHGANVMYRHLPTTDEINNRSDICERHHQDCDLN